MLPQQELLPGMILSNEPGYYKAGEFGIRTENLLLVEPRDIAGGEGEYYGFEALTLVPIDRRLLDCSLLTREELDWWNSYHARVLEVIGPRLEGEAKTWLQGQCAPL
jgi:Xaa-Pro aminopeptidase